jgi:hypothetical protein
MPAASRRKRVRCEIPSTDATSEVSRLSDLRTLLRGDILFEAYVTMRPKPSPKYKPMTARTFLINWQFLNNPRQRERRRRYLSFLFFFSFLNNYLKIFSIKCERLA